MILYYNFYDIKRIRMINRWTESSIENNIWKNSKSFLESIPYEICSVFQLPIFESKENEVEWVLSTIAKLQFSMNCIEFYH